MARNLGLLIVVLAVTFLHINAHDPWPDDGRTDDETYQLRLMKANVRTFALQQVQTVIITAMVVVLVGMGLRLSYLQFILDKDGNTQSVTTVKVGSGTIEVRSPVIGVIILALSLWFFQLYVQHVYKITPVNEERGATARISDVPVLSPLPSLTEHFQEPQPE